MLIVRIGDGDVYRSKTSRQISAFCSVGWITKEEIKSSSSNYTTTTKKANYNKSYIEFFALSFNCMNRKDASKFIQKGQKRFLKFWLFVSSYLYVSIDTMNPTDAEVTKNHFSTSHHNGSLIHVTACVVLQNFSFVTLLCNGFPNAIKEIVRQSCNLLWLPFSRRPIQM